MLNVTIFHRELLPDFGRFIKLGIRLELKN